jgi:hypothetical protein
VQEKNKNFFADICHAERSEASGPRKESTLVAMRGPDSFEVQSLP